MNDMFDIKIKDKLLTIGKVITSVFGDKYKDIICKKIDEAIYIYYCNHIGMEKYANEMLDSKRDELCLKFLSVLGINISKYDGMYYNEIAYQRFLEDIKLFMGNHNPFLNDGHIYLGIFSFKNESIFNELDEVSQIEFLNDYFFKGEDVLNANNYNDFKETKYFKRFYSKLEDYLKYFEELKVEYISYKKKYADSYLEYSSRKKERFEFIKEQNKVSLYKAIEDSLPEAVQDILKSKYSSKKDRAQILGDVDDELFGFKCFSTPSIEEDVLDSLLDYFKFLEVIDEIPTSLSEKIELYNKITKDEKYEAFIPSLEVISDIQEYKKELLFNSILMLLMEDETFNKYADLNKISFESRLNFASCMINLCNFVSSAKCGSDFVSVLFCTIVTSSLGHVDAVMIHEFIHLIFQIFVNDEYKVSGFEMLYLDCNNNKIKDPKNLKPYNNNYRINERFNETIVDILTDKVLYMLHKMWGIYLFEDKSLIKPYDNINTDSILRRILEPFVNDYFDILIEAMMVGDLNILYDRVGKDNVMKLNEVINYVDFLIDKFHLVKEIDEDSNCSQVYKKYIEEVEEVLNIYEQMRNYEDNKSRKIS